MTEGLGEFIKQEYEAEEFNVDGEEDGAGPNFGNLVATDEQSQGQSPYNTSQGGAQYKSLFLPVGGNSTPTGLEARQQAAN